MSGGKKIKGTIAKIAAFAALSATLGIWYAPSKPAQPASAKYALPATITVRKFSTERARFQKENGGLEQVIQTKDVDFGKPFEIVTDRYRLVRDEDYGLSQYVGKVGSLPFKLLFFDSDAGSTPDAERAKAMLSILEQNKDLKNITVRLGHNRATYDTWRLFTDENVKKRNGFVPRVVIGLPAMLLSESYAELFRGDYYNPMTQTVVMYSNIEAVGAHEVGHHKDYQRWSRDWAYSLATMFPPVKLYKEFAASKNASDLLGSQDQYQVPRYLFPAFLTYLFAGWAVSRKCLQKRAVVEHKSLDPVEEDAIKTFEVAHFLHDTLRPHGEADKLPEDELPQFHPAETARHFLHQNAMLLSAIGAYGAASDLGPWAATGAFTAGLLASDYVCDAVGDRLVPYTHERKRMMTRRAATSAYRTAGRGVHAISSRLHGLGGALRPQLRQQAD